MAVVMRFWTFLLLLLSGWFNAFAADVPPVLFVGEDFTGEICRIVEKKIADELNVLGRTAGMDVKCVHINGIGDARRIIASGEYGEFRALVVQCNDICENVREVEAIDSVVSAMGADVLWLTSDSVGANCYRGFYADYDGFCAGLKSSDLMRRAGYVADAVSQWWTGVASGNRGIERIPVWRDSVPHYEYSGPEYLNSVARIDRISTPELEVFLPHQSQKKPALVFFPGGGLSFTGFIRNAREAAELLAPCGIAVVGVKYRVKRGLDIALEDAIEAVKVVRSNARQWNIDPGAIGVAGQSAGALIVLRMISTELDAASRPDFAVPLTSWFFGRQEWPYPFGCDTPPVFMRHATNDSGYALAMDVRQKLVDAGVPLDFKSVDDGGHGAFEITTDGYGHGWTDELVTWMTNKGFLKNETE